MYSSCVAPIKEDSGLFFCFFDTIIKYVRTIRSMKITIVQNKYLNALLLLMLFSASVHMVILIVWAIMQRNLDYLNYFNILTLNYFFPGVFEGWGASGISLATVIVIYGIIFTWNQADEKR